MSSAAPAPASSVNNLGCVFPDLEVETDTLGVIRVHAYFGGGWGILFSHPRDFTPVCTTELGEASARAGAFAARGVKLLALSCDSAASHRAWRADICALGGAAEVPFPIIADEGRRVAAALGMLDEDEVDGAGLPATVRKVFVVGPDRRVKAVLAYPTVAGRSFGELLRLLDALQLGAAHAVATPSSWAPGGDVMLQPTLTAAEAAAAFPGHRTVPLPSGRGYVRMTADPGAATRPA